VKAVIDLRKFFNHSHLVGNAEALGKFSHVHCERIRGDGYKYVAENATEEDLSMFTLMGIEVDTSYTFTLEGHPPGTQELKYLKKDDNSDEYICIRFCISAPIKTASE
jgi:hypothetical protein